MAWSDPERRAAAGALLGAEAALREAHEAQARVSALLCSKVLLRGREAQADEAEGLLAFVHAATGARVSAARLGRLSADERLALEKLNGVHTTFPVWWISDNWVAVLGPTHWILQHPVVKMCHDNDWHKNYSVSM